MSRLLEIDTLRIAFDHEGDTVDGISLSIEKGEVVGISGPSGSGKSLTMWSILGLLPEQSCISGAFRFYNEKDVPVNIQNPAKAREYAGQSISIVPQNPFTSLNPVFRCGVQVEEMIPQIASAERKSRVIAHFKDLSFEDPERIYAAYPFELSGGQLQRVVIAMATIGNPDLVIADEPTTALDVQTQTEVLNLLYQWVIKTTKSMFLVSHDVNLLGRYCNRIYLVEKGRVINSGPASVMLDVIRQNDGPVAKATRQSGLQEEKLCEVTNLHVRYRGRSGAIIDAARGLSFSIFRGEALGIIGATGSGKSTIAKVLTGLIQYHEGAITFMNNPLDYEKYPELRSQIQMIFQDPYSVLYPHLSIGAYLTEAIRLHGIVSRAEEEQLISKTLEEVGLPSQYISRYPHQLSGGERQRIQIARAIIMKPRLLICDEITSGLDTDVQTQVLQLLIDLHQNLGMTLLVISHDLQVIRQMTSRVLIMHDGNIVESGNVPGIFENPQHDITQRLIGADHHDQRTPLPR